jgi:hypothetical protein
MEFKEAGGSVCVFVYVYTRVSARALHLASREQPELWVHEKQPYNMSKNSEAIFSAPANLKSNGWRSSGSYKKEGNIYKSFSIFLIV